MILDNNPARVLKLDRDTGDFRVYSTFADVEGGAAPRPNYGAWGPDGSLYVTDYGQGLIWRVPPGGGPAVVWLRDAKLEGSVDFGTTGLALAGDRRTLLVAQGSSAIGNGELNPATGKIYRVPIDPAGRPGRAHQAVGERRGRRARRLRHRGQRPPVRAHGGAVGPDRRGRARRARDRALPAGRRAAARTARPCPSTPRPAPASWAPA